MEVLMEMDEKQMRAAGMQFADIAKLMTSLQELKPGQDSEYATSFLASRDESQSAVTSHLLPLTQLQAGMLKQSWMQVQEDGCQMLGSFLCQHFYEVQPDTAAASGMDWSQVVKAIGFAIDRLDDLEKTRSKLVRLGRNHASWGTKEEHLHQMKGAFILALRSLFPQGFSSELEQAWGLVYDFVSKAMTDGLLEEAASFEGSVQTNHPVPARAGGCPFMQQSGAHGRDASRGSCPFISSQTSAVNKHVQSSLALSVSKKASKTSTTPVDKGTLTIPFTEVQLAVLKRSWKQIQVDHCQKLAGFLCQHFYEVQPDTAAASGMDWSQVVKAIGLAVDCLDDLKKTKAKFVRLGRNHARWGTKEHHLAEMKGAFGLALRSMFQEEFTAELEQAWNLVYDFVSEAMAVGMLQESMTDGSNLKQSGAQADCAASPPVPPLPSSRVEVHPPNPTLLTGICKRVVEMGKGVSSDGAEQVVMEDLSTSTPTASMAPTTSHKAIPLTQSQEAALKQSWQQVQEDDCQLLGDQLCQKFYNDDVEAVAGSRMDWAQVVQAIGSVVDRLEDLGKVKAKLMRLGGSHARWGTKEHQFNEVKIAFLLALRSAFGDAITPDAETAWALACDFVVKAMVEGLNQAATATS
eukprot:TRINITY_DN2611_c0_g1_i1.p1 TRINITY_DN2611_c0_g1~~TRINITY_DN2611_c0_g1_i1.p1  ORF type:complete len:741 (+),score=165.08 TRINITY_DN2611_c0_g1_i1:323-2224(+)